MNRVCIVGRMTRDAEARTTTTGKQVCEFSVAVDSNKETAYFFRVKAWGKTSDFVTTYLGKGRLVAIDGRLEQRRYTKSDGSNGEAIEIVADHVQGLDRRPDGDPPSRAHEADPPYQHAGGASQDPGNPPDWDPFADD